MAAVHREAIQMQIHQDWANREYIEVIATSIKRIIDFLNSFGKWQFRNETNNWSLSVMIQTPHIHFFYLPI